MKYKYVFIFYVNTGIMFMPEMWLSDNMSDNKVSQLNFNVEQAKIDILLSWSKSFFRFFDKK